MLVLTISVIVAAIPARVWIINLTIDDALYYPVVARNMVSGLGSTYDGFTHTNGYHPLWCWLQIPVAAATKGLDPMGYLWCIKLLMVAVIVLALVVWGALIAKISGNVSMTAAFVLLLGMYWWSVHTLYGGMETGLVVLLMGASLYGAHRLLGSRKTLHAIAFGVLLAACFLARLDSVFFIGVLGLFVLVKLGRDMRLQALWILPAVLLPIPYLIWNLTNFGSIVPVSGLRKTVTIPDISHQISTMAEFAAGTVQGILEVLHPGAAILAVVAIVLALWLVRRQLMQQVRQLGILFVIPIAAVIHFLYTAIFMTEADIYWYQYAEHLAIFLVAGVFVAACAAWLTESRRGRRLEGLPLAALTMAVVVVIVGYAPRKLPRPTNVASYQTAMWAKEHLQPESLRFGMIDSGVFRFVSGFNTVSLNGLAGDRAMKDLYVSGRIAEIIRRYHVDYVVALAWDSEVSKVPSNYVVFQSAEFKHSGRWPARFLIVDPKFWDGKSAFGLGAPKD